MDTGFLGDEMKGKLDVEKVFQSMPKPNPHPKLMTNGSGSEQIALDPQPYIIPPTQKLTLNVDLTLITLSQGLMFWSENDIPLVFR